MKITAINEDIHSALEPLLSGMCCSVVGSKEESFSGVLNTTGEIETVDIIPGWITNDLNHMPQDLLEEFRILTNDSEVLGA